jgi:hypothetical protein
MIQQKVAGRGHRLNAAMQKRIKPSIISVGILLISAVFLLLVAYSIAGSRQSTPLSPISNGLLHPLVPETEKLIRYHPADYPAPLAHVPLPQHPYMASNAGNNMHNDAYMSDAYEASGPLGLHPQVSSRTQGFGGYGTIAVDNAGQYELSDRVIADVNRHWQFAFDAWGYPRLEPSSSFGGNSPVRV